jgi:hypothetical protein
MEPNDYSINITLTQAQALLKTIGIALDNLQTKLLRTVDNRSLARTTQEELAALAQIQQQLLSMIIEVGA